MTHSIKELVKILNMYNLSHIPIESLKIMPPEQRGNFFVSVIRQFLVNFYLIYWGGGVPLRALGRKFRNIRI